MAILKTVQSFSQNFLKLEIWIVGVSAITSIVWPPLIPAAIMVAALFWLIRLVAYGRLSLRTPNDWAIIILIVSIMVTTLVTAFPETTMPQVFRSLLGVGLYYAIINWTDSPKRLRIVFFGMTLSSFILVMVAPVSVTWQIEKLPFMPPELYERFILLVSDTIHPNVLAGSLLIMLPIILCRVLFGWEELNWSERIITSLVVLFILIGLFLTQSRGAWIAFIFLILTVPLLRWRRGWILVCILVCITAGAAFYIGTEKIIRAFTVHTSSRLEIWKRAIYMIEDFPLTGIGMGSFLEVLKSIYPNSPTTSANASHAHNIFLQIAVDLGIPGLIAWIAILIGIVAISWQIFLSGTITKSGLTAGLGAGILFSQFALVIHGITDAVTWGMVRSAPVIWVIWGLTISAWMVTVKQTASRNIKKQKLK